jgi:hypothetical protein
LNSATLSWQTQDNTTFSITWNEKDSGTSQSYILPENKKDFSYTISNLKPNTKYSYVLNIKNDRDSTQLNGEFTTLSEFISSNTITKPTTLSTTVPELQKLLASLQRQLISLLTQLLGKLRG